MLLHVPQAPLLPHLGPHCLQAGRQEPLDCYHTPVQGNSLIMKRGKLGKGNKVPRKARTIKCIHSTLSNELFVQGLMQETVRWSDDPAEINPRSECLAGSDDPGQVSLA